MQSFLVESYKVRLGIQRQGSPIVTERDRLLEILSTPAYHGIVLRAVLEFSTGYDNWSSPVVGYTTRQITWILRSQVGCL